MPDSTPATAELSIGQCATLACLLEVSTPKPGNVHRGADFEDLSLIDFLVSATAIAPAIEGAESSGVGKAVLNAIRATRQTVRTNTNLGTVLLLAPLAAVPRNQRLKDGIKPVLHSLNRSDSADVYSAIRLANPGAMGTVKTMDLSKPPPADLVLAMQAAATRDMVARQYVIDFSTVLDEVVVWLVDGIRLGWSLVDTIIHTHLRLLRKYPDSLIARKCGQQVAEEASTRAAVVLESGLPGDTHYFEGLADLDFWLRSDHHRRNPGTTADLIAAGLFAGLRDRILQPPF